MAFKIPKPILYWCDHCALPVVRAKRCPGCEADTRAVKLTPPYELRPGFQLELELVRELCDETFGPGTGEALLPEGSLVLINDIPGIDRFEELVVDGEVVTALKYDIGQGYQLNIKIEGARRIAPLMTRNYVVLEEEAVPYILKKANTLRPGVEDFDPELRKGRDAVVLDPQRNVVAVGQALMSGEEAAAAEKGVVVKTRAVDKSDEKPSPSVDNGGPAPGWDKAIELNRKKLERLEEEAVSFVKRMVRENPKLPVSVSFSGGKDSLATLLVVLEAGLRPDVVFINTDLEFPETLDYVKETIEGYGLKLLEARAAGDFWEHFQYFGPPAKDYRWCCKTQKLGPVSLLFNEHYPEGVLSFIGQRKFESKEREKKGRVWRNPWVPLQLGASPIQNWSSLELWLYLLWKKAPVNVWYERGLSRIGCWLCPASDQGDMVFVEQFFTEGSEKLKEALEKFAKARGFSQPWVDNGLWRWKKPPQFLKDLPGLEKAAVPSKGKPEPKLAAQVTGGSPDPKGGFLLTAQFSRELPLEEVSNLLFLLGPVELEENSLKVSRVKQELTLHSDGNVEARGENPKALSKLLETARKLIIKALDCTGCGVCVTACKHRTLSLVRGKVVVDEDRCVHCLECVSPCPVADYKGR